MAGWWRESGSVVVEGDVGERGGFEDSEGCFEGSEGWFVFGSGMWHFVSTSWTGEGEMNFPLNAAAATCNRQNGHRFNVTVLCNISTGDYVIDKFYLNTDGQS